MSSAGHIQDMINRMHYNESLKKAKRERIKRVKDALSKRIKKSENVGSKNIIPKEEVLKVREQIRMKMQKEKRRIMIGSWAVVLLVFSVILYLIIQWGMV